MKARALRIFVLAVAVVLAFLHRERVSTAEAQNLWSCAAASTTQSNPYYCPSNCNGGLVYLDDPVFPEGLGTTSASYSGSDTTDCEEVLHQRTW